MAVFNQNPYETSFETLGGKAHGVVKQVKKAARDLGGAVAGDIKQQMGGGASEPTLLEQANLQKVPQQQQQQIQNQQQQVLAQTRQNLASLNQEIAEVRKKKQKLEEEKKKVELQKKQEKKAEEQKKQQEEPVWKQMLKKGSHEAMKNVAG